MLNKIKNFFYRNRTIDKDTVSKALEEFMEETTPDGEEINPNEKLILSNVLDLRELAAEDIMVPRAEIVAINHNASFEDLVKTLADSSKLQLPVYKDTLDNILGIINMRDVLRFFFKPKNFNIRTIIQEATFVAPSIKLDELLEQMRTSGKHLMFVVDEFGGIDGLVTLDRLMFKMLGNIQQVDARTSVSSSIRRQDGSYLIDAKMLIEEAEKVLSTKFERDAGNDKDSDIETVGGLIVSIANRVPVIGEIFSHPSGVTFEVVDSDLRRIKRVIARPTLALR
ncbi:MAG: CBS domain-containing protein [Holosporales bacterium]|nr:CBS domain-containing protein [Holosporales bacterium]